MAFHNKELMETLEFSESEKRVLEQLSQALDACYQEGIIFLAGGINESKINIRNGKTNKGKPIIAIID